MSNCAAKGWVLRDFPVNFLYSYAAVLNIAVKFSDEGPAVWWLADIGIVISGGEGGIGRWASRV